MNAYFSNYLNLLRFLAALIVLLSHFAYPRFTGSSYILIRDLNLGSDAVVLFFVLSGLVIAFSADVKDKSSPDYLFNRLTRLYSVAIPALILTYILDQSGSSLSPANYDNQFYNDIPFLEMLASGLSFTSEWGIIGTRLGSNGPYWSLSYEFAYYIAFALFCYSKGIIRIALLIGLAVITGPRIWILMPIWLLGCGVYHLIKTDYKISKNIAVICTFLPPLIYVLCLFGNLPHLVADVTENIFGINFAVYYLRFSDEFIWNNFIGLLTAIHFFGIYSLKIKKVSGKVSIKWLSGATFSIYIVHYPLLQFFDALLEGMVPSAGRDVVLLMVTLVSCFIFAALFERSLPQLRKVLRKVTASFAREIH